MDTPLYKTDTCQQKAQLLLASVRKMRMQLSKQSWYTYLKRLHNTASGYLFKNKSLVESLTIQVNGKAWALTIQLSEKALLVPNLFTYTT